MAGPWEEEAAHVEREIADKERAGLAVDAAELAEGLTSALGFVPQLETSTRSERDRLVTHVQAPGHELKVLYLTSLHHGAVAAGLARAAEMAQSTKLVVVREKRFEFPRTWETVEERRSAFERLANARWLWLEGADVARYLTLGRVLSQARAGKLRDSESGAPLTVAQLREAISTAHAPSAWSGVSSVQRWLSDVPRETAGAQGAIKVTGRTDARRIKRDRPLEPPAALREWLATGRDLGRAAVGHYLRRLRALAWRTPR
jgi:hypothetical protein